jgi:hypothetical protein
MKATMDMDLSESSRVSTTIFGDALCVGNKRGLLAGVTAAFVEKQFAGAEGRLWPVPATVERPQGARVDRGRPGCWAMALCTAVSAVNPRLLPALP